MRNVPAVRPVAVMASATAASSSSIIGVMRSYSRAPAGVGATLRVRVQPRASREEVVGERNGALLVKLTSPPADGAANRALLRLLAKRLGLRASSIRILQGVAARDKLLLVAGVSPLIANSSFS